MWRLTLFLLCLSQAAPAQKNFLSVLQMLNQTRELPRGVRTIDEVTYVPFNLPEKTAPDTTLQLGGQEIALYRSLRTVEEFPDPGRSRVRVYNHDGRMTAEGERRYNEAGQMLEENTQYYDQEGNPSLNSARNYMYDPESRLIRMTENGQLLFEIAYHSGYVIDSMRMSAGFLDLVVTARENGDTLRYDLKADLDPEMAAMMGDKAMPKEYLLLVRDEGKGEYTYFSYKEQRETGEMALTEVVRFDDALRLLEKKVPATDGSVSTHFQLTYDEAGRTTARTDLLEDRVYNFEYDASGRPLVEYDEMTQTNYTYAGQSNVWTTRLVTFLNGGAVKEWVVRTMQ